MVSCAASSQPFSMVRLSSCSYSDWAVTGAVKGRRDAWHVPRSVVLSIPRDRVVTLVLWVKRSSPPFGPCPCTLCAKNQQTVNAPLFSSGFLTTFRSFFLILPLKFMRRPASSTSAGICNWVNNKLKAHLKVSQQPLVRIAAERSLGRTRREADKTDSLALLKLTHKHEADSLVSLLIFILSLINVYQTVAAAQLKSVSVVVFCCNFSKDTKLNKTVMNRINSLNLLLKVKEGCFIGKEPAEKHKGVVFLQVCAHKFEPKWKFTHKTVTLNAFWKSFIKLERMERTTSGLFAKWRFDNDSIFVSYMMTH